MILKIYDKIIDYLVEKRYLSDEDKELYTYALKITIQGVLNIVLIFLLGVFLGMIKESLLLFVVFFLLRKFLGGLHLDKYAFCFISSALIHFVGLLIIKTEWLIQKELFIILLFISFVLITLFSPVAHPNKDISLNEKRVYKIVSVILSIICCLICVITIFVGNYQWVGYSIGTGLIVSCVLMCIGKIAYRKSNKN